jgi:hypothetical protein
MALHCKNDPSRTYSGTEPSPKGLGYCAHASPEGSTRKGKDGRQWTVRTDKNGTKAWKPATGKPVPRSTRATRELAVPARRANEPTLTYSVSGRFSDGSGLAYSIGHQPELYVDHETASLTRAHWDAVVSASSPVTLRLDRGETPAALPPVDVKIASPVTAGKVVQAMQKFYATKLTAADYNALEADLPNWNPLHVGKTMASFKKYVKTYGDCKAQYNALSGFRRALTWDAVYVPLWSS